jgi:RNA polymerase subunit RPABC4/transcription elongation factor Spt4
MTQDNTLIRSETCPTCGADMLWTQNAWPGDGRSDAAYRCLNGHVLDPATTRQCPNCGLHDTQRVDAIHAQFRCFRCGQSFEYPR